MSLRDSRLGRWTRKHPSLHKVVHATWCETLNSISSVPSRRGASTSGGGPPPALAVSISVTPNPCVVNTNCTISWGATGGMPPYKYVYTWTDPQGHTGQYPPNGYTTYTSEVVGMTEVGTYHNVIQAVDSAGASASANVDNVVTSEGGNFYVLGFADTYLGMWPPNLTVHFTGQEFNAHDFVSWEWDFGDGTQSFSQNPMHTYPGFGFWNPYVTGYIQTTGERSQFRLPPIVVIPRP